MSVTTGNGLKMITAHRWLKTTGFLYNWSTSDDRDNHYFTPNWKLFYLLLYLHTWSEMLQAVYLACYTTDAEASFTHINHSGHGNVTEF